MKKTLFVLALLSLNLSSYSSSQASNDSQRKAKIACAASMLLLPLAAFAGQNAFQSAVSAWSMACVKPTGQATSISLYKRDN